MQETAVDFDEPTTISLREYSDILRRRRAIILQAFLFVLIVGIIWTSFQTNIYRSHARLLIEPGSSGINLNNTNDPLNELFKISENYSIATQVEMLQTPDLMKAVAAKFNKPLPIFTVAVVEGTSIIEVSAESPDQNLAADATNALLETYDSQVIDSRGKELNNALQWEQNERDAEQKIVDETDRKIAKFKRDYNVVELEASRKSAADAFDAASGQNAAVQGDIAALKARVANITLQMRTVPPTITNVVSASADPLTQSLEQRIDDLETQKIVLAKQLTPENDRMIAIDTELADLTKRRADAQRSFFNRTASNNPLYLDLRNRLIDLDTDLVVDYQRQVDAAKAMQIAQKRIATLPNWEERFNDLTRKRDAAALAVTDANVHINDLQLRAQARPKLETILERAQSSDIPIRPNRLQTILFAGLLGLFLGLGLALLQEMFDDRINSSDEAERTLKMPSLGYIPLIEEEGLRLIRDISTFSPLMESYRTLRTNINFAAVGNQVRSLVLTSSVPAEGKSTTCANLAMAMAMDGKKVIIVDADLRRPSQHFLFKADASPGLTDILVGTHTIDQVLRPTSVENVLIIPAGSPPPNPAELLGSAAMGRFLAEVETRADIVLLDTPPALAVADAVVLSARADGALLVVGYGETKKGSVRRAKEMLARGNANILGTVLNRMDGPGGGYYYYGKYYMTGGYAPYSPNGRGGKNGDSRGAVGPYAPLNAVEQNSNVALTTAAPSATNESEDAGE